MKKFVLIGAAGFVAPRHMKAIKEVGGDLIYTMDVSDSVGILDKYFTNCYHFTNFGEFAEATSTKSIDYCVICTPNFCHFDQCKWALLSRMNVICEKPTVLTLGEFNQLVKLETQTNCRVYSILQLRLNNTINNLKNRVAQYNTAKLIYYTPRGVWYNCSWKGDICKSGGVATAIGVHLLDILLVLFGDKFFIIDWFNTSTQCGGVIKFGNTVVTIDLSLDITNSPTRLLEVGNTTYDLSKNFTDLHIDSYKNILNGNGIGLQDLKSTISLCQKLREY